MRIIKGSTCVKYFLGEYAASIAMAEDKIHDERVFFEHKEIRSFWALAVF